MGMRVSLAFFFFFGLCLRRARREKTQRMGSCQDELTEIVEGRPHFSFFLGLQGLNLEQVLAYRKCGEATALFFFFLRSEPGTGARPCLQKMWKVDRTFFFWVVGLNLEQVLAYRKCGEGIAPFFFGWRV